MKPPLASAMYADEWSRRDQLTGSVSTPIAVLTGLGGLVALMARSFPYDPGPGRIVFALAGGGALVCLVVAAVFLALSYHGYTYQLIPGPKELADFSKELTEYYVGDPEAADREFEAYLSDRYVEAAEANSRNNVSKAAHLYRASQAIILALALSAVSAVPWTIRTLKLEPSPTVVRLAEPITVELPPGTRDGRTEPTDTTTAAQPAAAPGNAATERPPEPTDTRR